METFEWVYYWFVPSFYLTNMLYVCVFVSPCVHSTSLLHIDGHIVTAQIAEPKGHQKIKSQVTNALQTLGSSPPGVPVPLPNPAALGHPHAHPVSHPHHPHHPHRIHTSIYRMASALSLYSPQPLFSLSLLILLSFHNFLLSNKEVYLYIATS